MRDDDDNTVDEGGGGGDEPRRDVQVQVDLNATALRNFSPKKPRKIVAQRRFLGGGPGFAGEIFGEAII